MAVLRGRCAGQAARLKLYTTSTKMKAHSCTTHAPVPFLTHFLSTYETHPQPNKHSFLISYIPPHPPSLTHVHTVGWGSCNNHQEHTPLHFTIENNPSALQLHS